MKIITLVCFILLSFVCISQNAKARVYCGMIYDRNMSAKDESIGRNAIGVRLQIISGKQSHLLLTTELQARLFIEEESQGVRQSAFLLSSLAGALIFIKKQTYLSFELGPTFIRNSGCVSFELAMCSFISKGYFPLKLSYSALVNQNFPSGRFQYLSISFGIKI
jgi:hypothetical protein